MKKAFSTFSAALLATLAPTACDGVGEDADGGGAGGPPLPVDADGVSTFNSTTLAGSIAVLPIETLNSTEQASLILMREKEKLAHDVYAYLDTLWSGSVNVFRNIANSESTHTEAVRQLLLRYNLPDPAATLKLSPTN